MKLVQRVHVENVWNMSEEIEAIWELNINDAFENIRVQVFMMWFG